MDYVDKLYDLIKKDNSPSTFYNNKELFLQLYYHNIDFVYGGPKVMDISKYILELNLDDENEEFPYINSKIFSAFNRYEQNITQSVYLGSKFDDDYIETLYKMIDDYYIFNKYKDNVSLDHLYNENTFIRDCTGAMMILLNNSFFNISNENITKMINSIKNNKYLQNIINSGKSGKELLDKEYIYDYTSRYLFNSYFYNENSIENDELLIALKEGKINDKTTFEKIIKNIDIGFILDSFNNDLSSIIDIIEKTFDDEVFKINISKLIINKIYKEGEYESLFNFIINDSRNNKYLLKEDKDFIISMYPYSNGRGLNDKEVNFYLNYYSNDKILLNNLIEQLKDNNWSEETIKKVKAATKDITTYNFDINTTIKVLNMFFKDGKKINLEIISACLKRLIKEYTKDENIKIYISYKKRNNGGTTYIDNNTIVLNVLDVVKLLKENNVESNPEILNIIDTAFHESRHILQFKDIRQNNMDEELYMHYKEELLGNLSYDYYGENYYGISFERDARICGAKKTIELLEKNFPYMTNSIEYFKQKEKNEIQNNNEKEKKIFELSDKLSVDEIIEKIISINPSLLKKYNALSKEYNSDGKKISNNTL